MDDLIRRDDALEALKYWKHLEAYDTIKDMPSMNKKGKWIIDNSRKKDTCKCSNCGAEFRYPDTKKMEYKYCPACGAEMSIESATRKKPLADFSDGECFKVLDADDNEEIYMAIKLGIEKWESPKTNVRFVVNLKTAELASFRDDFEYEPIEIEIGVADENKILRCKDCEYWNAGYGYCNNLYCCSESDDFCSWGERENADETD